MANKIIPAATDAPPVTGRTIRVLIDEINLIKNGIASQLSDQDSTNKGLAASIQLLTERLGALQGILDSLNEFIAIDANQVVSGVLSDARIPIQSAAKINGGALSVNSAGISGHTSTGSLSASGDATVSGHIYVPNATIASFGSWTVAYIDGNGRLTRGASSRRFKKDIIDVDLTDINLFAADLKEFEMIDGNGWRVLGYIAEDLVGTDMERFVVFERELDEDGNYVLCRDGDGNPVPLSIDFIPLILAQNRKLYEKQLELESRIEALES